MKEIILGIGAVLSVMSMYVILTLSSPVIIINANFDTPDHSLGSDLCTWGPAYWCENITTSAHCGATKHCIKQYWENQIVPEDNDDVCTICKDMVTQARRQLESNETQNDLRLVFEGSCNLIPLKIIASECRNLVDDFIPELVETLASQMNPSVVCSTAGLCNSPRIDRLLEEMNKKDLVNKKKFDLNNDEYEPNECSKCHTIVTHMQYKLKKTTNDEILKQMLHICGEMGSYSDSCSAILLTYFKDIIKSLNEDFNVKNLCHLSGQCTAQYHKHENDDGKELKVEVLPLSSVGMVDIGDDLPCKFCEQLVGHLRDVLVANTTEEEFRAVLEGSCKQTGSFSTECIAIVDEYYPQIYEFLTKGLNSNSVCIMCGLCPAPNTKQVPIWPLIPTENSQKIKINSENQWESLSPEKKQLPIERMFVPLSGLMVSPQNVNGDETCVLCKDTLRFIQGEITNPGNEEKLKKVIKDVCLELPTNLVENCQQMVNEFADIAIGFLVQQINPSTICPELKLCSSNPPSHIGDYEFNFNQYTLRKIIKKIQSEGGDKPSCPLCLFAVTELEGQIRSNKTEANIIAALDKLCSHLKDDLKVSCLAFVDGYSKELIEMLIKDLSPQEICETIKLCNPQLAIESLLDTHNEILTNEIPMFPVRKQHSSMEVPCITCEIVVKLMDKMMKNPSARESIKHWLDDICHILPKSKSQNCDKFIQQYYDIVIEILSTNLTPKQACQMIDVCKIDSDSIETVRGSVGKCALCQTIVSLVDESVKGSTDTHYITKIISGVCNRVPAQNHAQCAKEIKIYKQSFVHMFENNVEPNQMCVKIDFCDKHSSLGVQASPRWTKQINNHY